MVRTMRKGEKTPEEEALELIKTALRTRASELDLSMLGLTSVPGEIDQLTGLTVLHINNNRLSSIPSKIGELTKLTKLSRKPERREGFELFVGLLPELITSFTVNDSVSTL